MSIIEPIVPGGVGEFGGGPISVVGSGGSSGAGDGLWTVLAQLLLDSGSEYLAIRNLSLLGRTYDGRVLRWGRVEKSVPALSGMPETGDCLFRIDDPDYAWRDLATSQTLRGRTIRLKFVRADATADDFLPFFTGEIVRLASGPGYLEITARDLSWAWIDEPLQPLLTAENFPYLIAEAEGAFAKIVIGSVTDEAISGAPVSPEQRGAIELKHLGQVGSVDRFGAFRHTLFDIALYRRTSAGGAAFLAVDPGEYNVTVEDLAVEGFTYEMTFIDFLAVQEAGTVIRANVDGLYFRPAFGDYPAVGFDPVLNPSGAAAVLENPIDGILNLARLEFRKASLFDNDGIMAIRTLFAAMPLLSGGTAAYRSAGVVEESETPRAILGKYLPCFNLDIYHDRSGAIALGFSNDSPVGIPFFSDNRRDGARQMILRESFFEDDPSPVANRCVLPAYRHYAAGQWLWTGTYDNLDDQAALSVPRRNADDSLVYSGGELVRDARVEPVTSEVWFCRDRTTIFDVAARRMSFASLGSYRQYFDLPIPEVVEDVELTKRVLVTHRAGRVAGGYRQQVLKVIGLAYDLATFRLTLTTVRGIPGTTLALVSSSADVHGSATLSGESELSATMPGYSLIASSSSASPDTHTATTPPIDTTGAGFLVAAVGEYVFDSYQLVTDSYGNAWQKAPPSRYAETDDFGDLAAVQIWFCIPAASGPLHAVSVTNSNPEFPGQPSIAFAAFRGTPDPSPFDVENGSFAAVVDSLQPGSITPSSDGALIVTALASDSARPTADMSIDSGFTILENQPQIPTAYGVALAFLIQSSAAAVNPLWDTGVVTGGDLTASIAAFKTT